MNNILHERLVVLTHLVDVGASDKSLDEKLTEFLNILLGVSFLSITRKGLFMITEHGLDGNKGPYLRMTAQVGVTDVLKKLCSTVPYGNCLCGLAAEKQKIITKCQLDDDHHTRYHGMVDHGHFISPLISQGELFGVLCLYTACQYAPSEDEADFLKTVATIAASIVHHQMHQNQLAKALVSEQIMNDLNSVPVYSVRVDGVIRNANRVFGELFGVPHDRLLGTNITELYWSSAARTAALAVLNDKGVLRNYEVDFRHYDTGEKIICWINAQVMYDDNGIVVGYMGVIINMTSERREKDRLIMEASYDPLTGLPNRRLLIDKIDRMLKRQQRNDVGFAVLFVDLNGFKPVNDIYGHASGDVLLQLVARRLLECIRPSDAVSRHDVDDSDDTVGRIGGDEFVAVLLGVDSVDKAKKIIERVTPIFKRAFIVNDHSVELGASIGISIAPMHGNSANTLLKAADKAMYAAKEAAKKESPGHPVTTYQIAGMLD